MSSHGCYMCTHGHPHISSDGPLKTSSHLPVHIHVSPILTRLCCGKPSEVIPSFPLTQPLPSFLCSPPNPNPSGGLWGRRGSHKMTPEKPTRTHWVAHGLQRQPKFYDKTRETEKKGRKWGTGEGKNSVKFWAHTLRAPTLRASTLGLSPSDFRLFWVGPPPFGQPPFGLPPCGLPFFFFMSFFKRFCFFFFCLIFLVCTYLFWLVFVFFLQTFIFLLPCTSACV